MTEIGDDTEIVLVQHPFSPELYNAIGRIGIAMAQIDDLLSLLVFRLAGLSQQDGAILTGQMGVANKIKCVVALVKAHPAKAVPDLPAAKEAIEGLNRLRNALFHGVYQGREESSDVLHFTMRANVLDPIGDEHTSRGYGYSEAWILGAAQRAPSLIAQLKRQWGLAGGRTGRMRRDPRHRPVRQQPISK